MSTSSEVLSSPEVQLIHTIRGNPFFRVMLESVIDEYKVLTEKSTGKGSSKKEEANPEAAAATDAEADKEEPKDKA